MKEERSIEKNYHFIAILGAHAIGILLTLLMKLANGTIFETIIGVFSTFYLTFYAMFFFGGSILAAFALLGDHPGEPLSERNKGLCVLHLSMSSIYVIVLILLSQVK